MKTLKLLFFLTLFTFSCAKEDCPQYFFYRYDCGIVYQLANKEDLSPKQALIWFLTTELDLCYGADSITVSQHTMGCEYQIIPNWEKTFATWD